jgi:magnesium transporter
MLRLGGAGRSVAGRARGNEGGVRLHELAVEDARNGHQRPKIEEYGASMFVVLHLVELVPAARRIESRRGQRLRRRNYILSVRNRSPQGFLGVRERAEREPDLLRLARGSCSMR